MRPAFSELNVPVVFASDNNYAPILAAAAASLAANANPANNYDLIVLADSVSAVNRRRLLELARDNVSVRLFDMAAYLKGRDLSGFYITAYVSVATYYRFFLPDILADYDKALYLDCDLIIQGDVAELYAVDLGHNLLGAVRDLFMPWGVEAEARTGASGWREYLTKALGLRRPEWYFQAGVLLLNLEAMRRADLLRRCREKLREVRRPRHWDQCVLNAICQGRVHFLPQEWNLLWEAGYAPDMTPERFRAGLPADRRADYDRAVSDPKIVHYCSGTKVWTRPDLFRADVFWHYARLSPAYEEIFARLVRHEAERTLVAAADASDLPLYADTERRFGYSPSPLGRGGGLGRDGGATTVADRHAVAFSRHRGAYAGRDLVLVATGPSLARYRPIAKAAHVGVNRTFLRDDLRLDAMFVQDFSGLEGLRDRLAAYGEGKTAKFYGVPTDASGIKWAWPEMPAGFVAYYCLDGGAGGDARFNADIENLPLFGNGSVTFPALQFALFTRPARLFLVGCDGTGSGNLEAGREGGFREDAVLAAWRRFAEFAARDYPGVEIVSVNPVRLAGMFGEVRQ